MRSALVSTRGDFLEFDETYYLLIARSLGAGEGFAMNGLPQIAFPPLPALVLVALDRLFGSMVAPSRIVSALLGALLVLPVHGVARRWLGRRAALIAALFTATCPTLMTFVPVEAPYARRLYFGHEPLHVLLVYLTLWALLGAIRRPTALAGAAAGGGAALCYLSRNESILFGGAAVAIVAFAALRSRRKKRREEPGAGAMFRKRARWPAAVCAVVTLVVVAAPYPIYLHRVTGSWALTGKSGTAALIRPTVVALVRDDDTYAFEKAHYALAPSGDRMASSYWGWAGPRPEGGLGLTAAGVADNMKVYAGVLLPVLVPWPLWPFLFAAVARWIRRGRGGRRRDRLVDVSIASLLPPSLAVCAFLFIEPRHHLYLVPLALMVAAAGLLEAVRWIRRPQAARRPDEDPGPRRQAFDGSRRLYARRLAAVLSAAVTAALLALSLWPLKVLAAGDPARAEAAQIRMMGEILREEVPEGEPVMSWHPALGFWAGRGWRVMPSASLPQIAAYALARGAGTIVFETSVFGPPPGETADEAAPFALFKIEGLTSEQAERSLYRIERMEESGGRGGRRLFNRYRITGPDAAGR